MSLAIIVAVADNRAIGRAGDLAFHISADLRRFKELTMGHPIIMGRKTFESLPKGALPGRRNIVITGNSEWSAHDIEIARDINQAIDIAGENAFIIGGGQIYEQSMPLVDTLYITRIFAQSDEADTFFPLYEDSWEIVGTEPIDVDPKTGIEYQFQTLKRKK